MDTVRIAKSYGDVSALFPPGIDRLTDLPYTHFEALMTATVITGWDELAEEEQPSRDIWLHPEKLKAHFDKVKKDRDAKYGSNDRKAIEDPVENEAASLLMAG